jgi:putative glutamine amidotransferase
VTTEAGTATAAVLGASVDDIHSHHHQGIDRVGDGLVVSAHAADGSIEAIEDPGQRFCMAVLWHPEESPATSGAPLFRALVEAAREHAQG